MPAQAPHSIEGTVTLNGTAVQGARIWAIDITEGTFPFYKEDITVFFTNASGQYTINLANITSAYSDADTIRVYCQYGDMITFSDGTVDNSLPSTTVNFALTSRGPSDGLKDTVSSDGKGGFRHFGTGMRTSLKDGLS